MPEGDTIHRMAEALRRRLVGKIVLEAGPSTLSRLSGTTVVAVEPVGKHLLMRFSDDLVLQSHMRMHGTWHLYRPGERWRKPERLARAVLVAEDVVAVCFNTPAIELTRDPRIDHLGPDLLGEAFDLDAVVRRARESGHSTVGELLLDQRVASGIGNVYKCEVLWWLGLNPWTSPSALNDVQLRGLYSTARDFMRSNLLAVSARRFATYGRQAVHGRAGRPCRRCGSRIQVRAQGEHARLTYFCPRCQNVSSQLNVGLIG
jgi:endonuclease-8